MIMTCQNWVYGRCKLLVATNQLQLGLEFDSQACPPTNRGVYMKYRKKPVVIEALIWRGHNLKEIIAFTGLHESANKWSWEEYKAVVAKDGLKIFTLEGAMLANIGDYIIQGVNGEFYPCKPDIFHKTYEPVIDNQNQT